MEILPMGPRLCPSQVGCSIKDIYHERAWVDTDIASVRVKCIVETSDRSHADTMYDALLKHGYEVSRDGKRQREEWG